MGLFLRIGTPSVPDRSLFTQYSSSIFGVSVQAVFNTHTHTPVPSHLYMGGTIIPGIVQVKASPCRELAVEYLLESTKV